MFVAVRTRACYHPQAMGTGEKPQPHRSARPLTGHAVLLLGMPMRVLATIFVEDDRAYAVTCTAPAASYDTYAAMFHEIAASFELSS